MMICALMVSWCVNAMHARGIHSTRGTYIYQINYRHTRYKYVVQLHVIHHLHKIFKGFQAVSYELYISEASTMIISIHPWYSSPGRLVFFYMKNDSNQDMVSATVWLTIEICLRLRSYVIIIFFSWDICHFDPVLYGVPFVPNSHVSNKNRLPTGSTHLQITWVLWVDFSNE